MTDVLGIVHEIDPAPWLWPFVLAHGALYLIGLGLASLWRPAQVVGFLSAFAQTRRANRLEAALRALFGLALVGMAPRWTSVAALAAGLFLVVTALAMLAWPDAHRRLAARSVASVAGAIRLIGLASLVLGCALIVLLAKTAY